MSIQLFKSTAVVGGSTFLSRILGFIRDMVIAQVFGAGLAADTFFVAFKIPNFLRRLFAEGAFSQAFVPVFSFYVANKDPIETKTLIDRTTGTLGIILFFVTGLGIVGAPLLVIIFAPGFIKDPDQYKLATQLLQITFPYLFFISLTALAAGILNTYKRFSVPAITPIFLNITLIISALWIAPTLTTPVVALAWGVFFAGLIQLLFQIPFLKQLKLLPKPHFAWKDTGVQKIFTLMLPAIIGSSVSQINLLVDTILASFLTTGSISWLYYGDRLVEFPLGVFGIALSTVILPTLSEKHSKDSPRDFSHTLDWALRWACLISIPAAIGLALLATPIITTLFYHGEFSKHDAIMTVYSLIAYSFGLIPFILIKILASGFYARQDTKTPMKIGVVSMVSNIVLNIILMVPLAHVGLALATSLSAWLNAALLFIYLKQRGIYTPQPKWFLLSVQITIASGLMAFFILWKNSPLVNWIQWNLISRIEHLLILITLAIVIYSISLLLMGVKPKMLIMNKHNG
ncbi:murein biosynthesis integral membrane protein MurJ [Candidatus Nitrosacidococcus sp. I8]|uniref:murein biosynthesis integral membrane protein MurJ n=1 Tax=Candidatus Nitrosacidococcus sp. I8 TaxID=2942908 RepID=UPI002226A755|nr:murein biosynthesis integral membrane protein MurJ [Candidatus Nitrosacidococcus sp. I8]CAH9019839.1 putative lipid II flippase MurJ [Candidatus Nitrosacidococcus sp. I8]